MDNAFVVPQQAVTRGSQDTVMVVNDKSEMEARVVTIAQQQGSNWVITDGLKDGRQSDCWKAFSIGRYCRVHKQVTPKEWTPPASAAAATPAVSDGQAASEAKPEAKAASEAK